MLRAHGKSNEQRGTMILLDAMSKDKVHLARFFLDALDGEIVDSKTESARTPLMSSVLLPDSHARCKLVELLLQRGANVNCQDCQGRTALSFACERGYLDAVKILVRNNADPEMVDTWGNTALMYAVVAGRSPVVEFLVRAFKRLGLQIDRQNKVGNSAVELAKFLGHTECISALTNNSKKSREAEGRAQGCGVIKDKFEGRVGQLVNKPDDLQACNHTDCLSVQDCSWKPRPRAKQSLLSIEEFERENEGSSSPPNKLVFSEVLNPKPPPRTPDQFLNCKQPKTREDHLPPLKPRVSRHTRTPSAPSALDILLAPISANKSETDVGKELFKTLDFRVCRFHDSYYQKRSSLQTSILSPTPPERTLVPVRKSRTIRRRETSPCKVEPPPFIAPTAAVSAKTFSVLGNKLLRRFTSPEFKEDTKELEENLMGSPGRIQRSETFPQDIHHPQVGSKSSIDSISSVKCEFGVMK